MALTEGAAPDILAREPNREALDQQRASGEVLAAISSSIADTAPVFDKILASCERLFAGKVGQINLIDDDGMVHLAAYHGPGMAEMDNIFPFPVDDRSSTGLSIERRAVRAGAGSADPADILAGLTAGERVVVEGPADLVEGTRVEEI